MTTYAVCLGRHLARARQVNVYDYDDLCQVVSWCRGNPVNDDEPGVPAGAAIRLLGVDTVEHTGYVYARHGDWIVVGRGSCGVYDQARFKEEYAVLGEIPAVASKSLAAARGSSHDQSS